VTGRPPLFEFAADEGDSLLFDDARVRRVVAFDDGLRLTPELIDQLCGRGAP